MVTKSKERGRSCRIDSVAEMAFFFRLFKKKVENINENYNTVMLLKLNKKNLLNLIECYFVNHFV